MVRLGLIVLVALQILLVKSFPADVLIQNGDNSEAKAINEDLDALINEVPNTENSNRREETFDNVSEETDQRYEDEHNDESFAGVDEDAEREGGEYKEEENLGNSHVIEGDIYVDKSTTNILSALQNNAARDAVTNAVRLWPRGRVPYVFGRVSSRVKSAFRQAIEEYNKYTCIRVVPRRSEKDYVYVVSEGGCWSSISKSGGRQKLSLGRGCEYKGIAIHELMHALGFFHEQSRLDRDNFITIHWNNIVSGREHNFRKYSHGQADTLNEPYDYGSIMHYPRKAFTRNGKETIVPKRSGVKIGQRRGLSRIDIRQLNKLYKCGGVVVPTRAPTKPTGPCVDKSSGCKRWAKARYCVRGRFINYMRRKCKKSCGLCKGIVNPKCFDRRAACPRWAKSGFCISKYTIYMNKNCRKSCKKC